LPGGGDTCGTNSTLRRRWSIHSGIRRDCDTGFAYNIASNRTVRQLGDVDNQTMVEINHCKFVVPPTSRPASRSPSHSPSKTPTHSPTIPTSSKTPSKTPTTFQPSTSPSKSPTTSRPSQSTPKSPTTSTPSILPTLNSTGYPILIEDLGSTYPNVSVT